MSVDVSIVVNQVSPADITTKIALLNQALGFAKILDNQKINAVVDFVIAIDTKPIVATLIADLLNAWQSGFKSDLDKLVTELKK